MKKLIKNSEKTLLMLAKVFVVLVLFVIFYAFFLSESPELLRISRVSTIISSTFLVLCYIMLRLYEGLDFGKKSTREISLSIILAVIFTDIFTFCQLCIMEKRILPVRIIIEIIIVHTVACLILAKLVSSLFFAINEPVTLTVVYTDTDKMTEAVSKLRHYQHRYTVKSICRCDDIDIKEKMLENIGVFLIDTDPYTSAFITDFCYKENLTLLKNPQFTDILINTSNHEMLDDYSVFISDLSELPFESRFIKRLCDILISSVCLIILHPVMILEAIAIKLQDGGKIFFSQERETINGKIFKVLKFRTMIQNAEKKTGAVLAVKNDSRITTIGKFLRKTRLDEIPQLINVLKGDMSIVGPRPERSELSSVYIENMPEFSYRLKVKAGLTGLAQINGKYSTTPKDKLTLDLIYIRNYSLVLDIKILLRTLIVILTPEKSE